MGASTGSCTATMIGKGLRAIEPTDFQSTTMKGKLHICNVQVSARIHPDNDSLQHCTTEGC